MDALHFWVFVSILLFVGFSVYFIQTMHITEVSAEGIQDKMKEFEKCIQEVSQGRHNLLTPEITEALRVSLYLHLSIKKDTELTLKCSRLGAASYSLELFCCDSGGNDFPLIEFTIVVYNIGSLIKYTTELKGKKINIDDLVSQITARLVELHNLGKL